VTIPYVFVAAIAVARPWALMAFISLPLALRPARRVMAGESGRGLVEVLGVTGRLQLVFGVLLAAGIAL
jgi:1,4-dihydroxy-2-naphthoate octaprenyltransferase